MKNNDKTFQKALSNFTFDMASRGAIRHLAGLGYTAAEIHDRLDFPTPIAQIEEELRALEAEKDSSETVSYEYIRETDAYGKTSFRRVEKKN